MGCVKSVPEDTKADRKAKEAADKEEAAKQQRRRLSVAPEHVGDMQGDEKKAEAAAAAAPAEQQIQVRVDDSSAAGGASDVHGALLSPLEKQARGNFRHASLSKKGVVPYNRNKVNQDREVVKYALGDDPDVSLFAVMDGHGEFGHLVAEFVKQKLPEHLARQRNLKADPVTAMTKAVKDLVDELGLTKINIAFSGTTCIFAVKIRKTLYVGNIGDSRCVLARTDAKGKVEPVGLSEDQKPENPHEKARIIKAGGRVEPLPGPPGEDCGPPRVWLAEVDVPGLAMSRSIGDEVSQTVGVISVPEIRQHELADGDMFAIWASDGVWEFISNLQAVQIVNDKLDNLESAAAALCEMANKKWRDEEEVIDDITCVILKFPADL